MVCLGCVSVNPRGNAGVQRGYEGAHSQFIRQVLAFISAFCLIQMNWAEKYLINHNLALRRKNFFLHSLHMHLKHLCKTRFSSLSHVPFCSVA